LSPPSRRPGSCSRQRKSRVRHGIRACGLSNRSYRELKRDSSQSRNSRLRVADLGAPLRFGCFIGRPPMCWRAGRMAHWPRRVMPGAPPGFPRHIRCSGCGVVANAGIVMKFSMAEQVTKWQQDQNPSCATYSFGMEWC
jgi:hypothetical protein